MKRRLSDNRIETYKSIVEGKCTCGQSVIKVTGSNCTAFTNGDRYHYPEDNHSYCIFRCKSCCEPICDNFIALSLEELSNMAVKNLLSELKIYTN